MRKRMLNTLAILTTAATILVAVPRFGISEDKVERNASTKTKIFSGEPRLLIVHGYSTSAHWWAFLQRKIDRYMSGPDKRVVEVQLCNKGGTPIAKWMDVKTGERSRAWKQMLSPMIQAEKRATRSVYRPLPRSSTHSIAARRTSAL